MSRNVTAERHERTRPRHPPGLRPTAAAGDKAVQVVGGPDLIRQLLRAGLVDELHIDVMPVLLGAGLRLFDDTALEPVELEKIGVQEVGPRTSLRFRVTRR